MREIVQALQVALSAGETVAQATVIAATGSTPQGPSARLLLFEDGRRLGTVGGGAIELVVLRELQACLVDGRARVVRKDLGADLGMCCGGRMEIFVERIEGPPRLILCGAGHVAQPTAALARSVGFVVIVVDDRPEWNNVERFPGCEVLPVEADEAAERVKPNRSDWILLMTHDHQLDERALAAFGACPHRYLGLIGSRRKVFRLFQRLHARGRLPPLERVYAPVGLDLGASSPPEIALSIVAELLAVRRGRPANHLRVVEDERLARLLNGTPNEDMAAALEAAQDSPSEAPAG